MLFQLQYMQPQTPPVQSAATIIYKSPLTHLPLDKMATISQTILFSNAFSRMKHFVFWLKFHWRLSQGSNWQSSSIGLDNGLSPIRRQAIIWTNADPINWRIYATLGGDELTQMFIVSVCKSLSTVWAPKYFIRQESYEHKITQNLTNYMPQLSLIANYKNILDSIMKQLSLPYWYLTSTYSSQHINHFLPDYAYPVVLHSNTPNKNISWTVKYLCKIPTAYVDYNL